MRRPLLAALALFALVVRPCVAQQLPPAAAAVTAPSLVVLVTVDQLRADYLDRWAPQLRGGLARLVRGGARFTDAHQDHGITETAPGHASLLSGRFPRSTGIWSNASGVDDPTAPLIGSPGAGVSPLRFRGTTLVDWLHARDRASRALGLSAKDRGAILPIGRARQQLFWYAADGRFTTSRYYADTLPTWVQRFNERRLAQARAGQTWTLLLADSAYRERDSVAIEGLGHDNVFPHRMPADSAAAAIAVLGTPSIDEIVLALALDGLGTLGLGAGAATDVLSVSLSATDFIGHRYGPDSREVHDQVLRLDLALGTFLDSLYRLRDSSRVALVLTADHGVAPVPELMFATVQPPPMRVELPSLLAALQTTLRSAGVDSTAVILAPPLVLLDRRRLSGRNVGADSLLTALAAAALLVPGVLRADRWRDLLRADHARDPIARRWVHQFPADAAVDLVLTLTPGSLWGDQGPVATHGSPHGDDTHVPLIFHGPAFRPGRYAGFVRTVDIAPTLAAVAGVTPAEPVDGVVLRAVLRAP